MRIEKALIIRRLRVPESMQMANECAASCEKHNLKYEFIDGVEFMSSEDAVKSVGAWLHHDNVKKKVSTGNNNCHASHIKAWRRIIEIGKPCLILEHDSLVKGDVRQINIPDDSIITFGHRVMHPDSYNPICKIQSLVKIRTSIGGHAYGITPKTAEWLVNDVEQNGVNINVDEWINLRCGLPLYITDPTQVVCWPRTSTREWVEEDKKREFLGHTTTFGESYTELCKAGYK